METKKGQGGVRQTSGYLFQFIAGIPSLNSKREPKPPQSARVPVIKGKRGGLSGKKGKVNPSRKQKLSDVEEHRQKGGGGKSPALSRPCDEAEEERGARLR